MRDWRGKKMKKILSTLLFLVIGWQTTQAQNLSMYMVLEDSAYQTKATGKAMGRRPKVGNEAEYQSANKYQKDAILFMDMIADTHPYFIKAERRTEWFAKKAALLEKCKTIETDEALADALNEVLGKLKDRHTTVTTTQQLNEATTAARKKLMESGITSFNPDRAHIMRPHATVYDYQLFPEQHICYLQFNKCADDPADPFASLLNRMFAEMEKENIKTLVVDVQYNSGGNDLYCSQLLDHLYPISQLKNFAAFTRLSDFMIKHFPNSAELRKNWESTGHKDELYPEPAPNANYQQPKRFEGQVVFVMGPETFSSAGNLLTLARDNHFGTIIGTTSTFGPSHYGHILPFRFPNTSVWGSVSIQFFERPDKAKTSEPFMQPDIEVNLDDKDAAWQFIVEKFGTQ